MCTPSTIMDMTLKKSKVEEESVEKFAMANCVNIIKRNESLGRPKIFRCKKCNKRFESFQALGGHNTNHKNRKNKFITMNTNGGSLPVNSPIKYECSICGKEFAIGQALGGHMRKHRDELNQIDRKKKKLKENSKSGKIEEALHDKTDLDSTRRTLFLDLNLTAYENE